MKRKQSEIPDPNRPRKAPKKTKTQIDEDRAAELVMRGFPLRLSAGSWWLCGAVIPDTLASAVRRRIRMKDVGGGLYKMADPL